VEVPEELKRSLKGEDAPATDNGDEGEYRGDMIDEILSSQKSNYEEIENSDLMKRVLQTYSDLKFSPFEYDLRIKDASYTVTNYLQPYELSDAEKNKQHYNTVISSSFVAKFVRKLKYFIKHHEWSKKSDTRILLDGVNLRFESGKMYLVLGGMCAVFPVEDAVGVMM